MALDGSTAALSFTQIFQQYVPILSKIKTSLLGDTTNAVATLSSNLSAMKTSLIGSIQGSNAYMHAANTLSKVKGSQMATDFVAAKGAFTQTLQTMLTNFKASPFMSSVTKGITSALSYAKRFLTFFKGLLTQASTTQFMGIAISSWILWAIIAAALLFVIWKIIKWFKNRKKTEGFEIPDFRLREEDVPAPDAKTPPKAMGKLQKKFYTSAIDVSENVGKEIVSQEAIKTDDADKSESGFFTKFLKTIGKFIIYTFIGGIILLILNHFGLLDSLKNYAGFGAQVVANH